MRAEAAAMGAVLPAGDTGDVIVGIYVESFQGDETLAKSALVDHRTTADVVVVAAPPAPAAEVIVIDEAASAPPAKKPKKEKKPKAKSSSGGGAKVGSGVNAALADMFFEMAVLEGSGFKANAYKKVGSILCTMCAVTEASGKGGGKINGAKVDGIGKASAEKIAEWLETGKIAKLETMRAGGA